MKLLHIDASITGPGSVSRQLSKAIVDELRRAHPDLQVVRRDLDADPVPHLDSTSVGSLRPDLVPTVAAEEASRSARLLQEFLDADVIVIGAPMYNFSIPSQLKAWFDRILVGGKTFRYTEHGPEGLAGGKKVIVAVARGNIYSPGAPAAPYDFHEPYLRTLFGFIGIGDVAFVRAEGLAISPDHRRAGIDAALASIGEVVDGAALATAA